MKSTHPYIIGIVIALFVGTALGFIFSKETYHTISYPLLSWRIQTNNPHDIRVNFRELRLLVEGHLEGRKDIGSNVSIFFEYLPTGVSFSIQKQKMFVAASLMKVPIVMTAYALHDRGLLDLDKKVSLKKEWLNDGYGTLYQRGVGYSISIRDAARLALIDSDNTAILLLWDQVSPFLISEIDIITHLNLDIETYPDNSVGISPESYASILKCLYFSCYLSKGGSQEVLHFLSQSSFNHRLARDIPSNIIVAHKIGTFQNSFQSDCGIIYAPQKPYLLCIMVAGEEEESSEVIADISRIIFEFIAK